MGWSVTDVSVVLVRLSAADTGEVLTLQRAAYVTEAQAHGDLALPPLVQSPDELAAELVDPQVVALGLWGGARLVAAVRVHIEDEAAELGRLVSRRTDKGAVWAAVCCVKQRNRCPSVSSYCGCSRVNTATRISACTSDTATPKIIGLPVATTSLYT